MRQSALTMLAERASSPSFAISHLVLAAALLAAAASAWAASGSDMDCASCVEDVVVETRDGRLVAGYIYWRSPPFRYLDLEQSRARATLRANGGALRLRLWAHAVSIARDRLPDTLVAPPPAPVNLSEGRLGREKNVDEIALLVGEPLLVPTDSVRRIYPRIGSGWPAVEISQRQLLQLAESHLPLHPGWPSGCSGCPSTVEDVTLVLRSGGLVSGLLEWHAPSSPMEGYDLEDPSGREAFLRVYHDPSGEVRLWPRAVSGPRRTFSGTVARSTGEVGRHGFFRLSPTALLVEAPYAYTLDDIRYILPGPSWRAFPLPIDRQSALRLLHQSPHRAAARHGNSASTYCFSYDAEISAPELDRLCRKDSSVFRRLWDARAAPPAGVLGLWSSVRFDGQARAFEGDPRVIAICFDFGT